MSTNPFLEGLVSKKKESNPFLAGLTTSSGDVYPGIAPAAAPSSGGGSPSFLGRVESGTKGLATGVVQGVAQLAKSAAEDTFDEPVSLLAGPLAPLAAAGLKEATGQKSALVENVAKPIAESYAYKYGPAFHGDFGTTLHRAAEDPVGTFLDVATLVTLPFTAGGSAALRGVGLARAAEVGDSLRAGRTLSIVDEAGKTHSALMRGTPSPFWRAAQAAGDLASIRGPQLFGDRLNPLSATARIGRASRAQIARTERLSESLVHPYRRALAKLSPAETLAVPLIAQKINRASMLERLSAHIEKIQADQIASAATHHLPAPTKDELWQPPSSVVRYMADLEKYGPKIDAVLAEVRPPVLEAVKRGRRLADAQAETYIRAGFFTPEAAAARVSRPSEVIAGSRFVGGEIDQEAVSRLTRAANAEGNTLRRLRKQGAAPERIARQEARASKADRELADATAQWTTPNPADLAKVTSGIHEGYGDPFYMPHVGNPTRGLGAKGTVLEKVPIPGETRMSQMTRLVTGELIHHPDVLSSSYLRSVQWKTLDELQKWAATHATPRDPELVARGGVEPGHRLFNPGGAAEPRAVAEAPAMHTALDRAEQLTGSAEVQKAEITRKVGDLLPQTTDARGIAGSHIMQVPEWVAREIEREMTRSSYTVAKIYDRVLDVWRSLVLSWRPTWLVNNIVGQHLIYAIKTLGTGGLRSYIRSLQLERPEAVKTLDKWSRRNLPRSVYGEVFRQHPSGELLSLGGFTRSTFQNIGELPKTPGRARAVARKLDVGHAMQYLNYRIADDQTRLAAALHVIQHDRKYVEARNQLRGWDGVLGKVKSMVERHTAIPTRLLGEDQTLREFIAGLSEKDVQDIVRQVDELLGNFTKMTDFERRYVRRVMPFYSWFKVISTLSLRLVADDPLRVNFVRNLELAAQQAGGVPGFPVPSYLEGAIPIGDVKDGKQPLLSTTGLNPFQTLVQLGESAGGVVSGQPSFGSAGPLSVLTPFAAGGVQAIGLDPFFGGRYHGPLNNLGVGGRFLAATATGLPEYRLAEQTTGAGGYKSTLYANTPLDFWLNFLGWPVKRTRKGEATTRAKAGQ